MEVPMNSAQSGAHFPVQHRSVSLDIKGNKTDIVISKYEDTFLVIVTQIGCMGTILAAKYAFLFLCKYSPAHVKFNFVICIFSSAQISFLHAISFTLV
jgi:hypothetical protein